MTLDDRKKQLLDLAAEAFARQTGLMLTVAKGGEKYPILRLQIPEETRDLKAVVLVSGNWALTAHYAFYQENRAQPEYLLVLPQVTAAMADNLLKDGVQFIDAAGNAYINQPPVYLFVKGNKAKKIIEAPTTPRAFKQTGLRVLYALLCVPGLENEPYRTIADKAKVALGMVNWVVKDLQQLGYLLETGSGRNRQLRLLQKEQLLERWVTAYAEQLRPKLVLGRYQGAEGWWQQAVLNPEEALWGGEVAAAKLTDYLKPQMITIYADRDNPTAVLLQNRLKKDPQGEVELVARFWQPETVAPRGDMVHPLLVYADLMATGNQRNIETARMIYDQHLVQLLRED